MWLICGGQWTRLNKRLSLSCTSTLQDGLLSALVQVYFYSNTLLFLDYDTFWNVVGGMKGADIGVGWVDQRGNIHFQVWRNLFFMCMSTRIGFILSRIDILLILWNLSLIIQPLIGSLFKVENKMDGQPFNSNVCLILAIRWTIQLRSYTRARDWLSNLR